MQQLDGHVAAPHEGATFTQALAVHTWPAAVQLSHTCPLLPQAVLEEPTTQVPLAQHPLGQVVTLQPVVPLLVAEVLLLLVVDAPPLLLAVEAPLLLVVVVPAAPPVPIIAPLLEPEVVAAPLAALLPPEPPVPSPRLSWLPCAHAARARMVTRNREPPSLSTMRC